MKILKRNQIIVTVIALMLVAAGYLNFANQNRENNYRNNGYAQLCQ